MTVSVLDARMQPVPIGVTGELYVGGVGVARGYAGQPGLTAGRFVPDPYGTPGTRLYRTGDAVRLRADGVVEFVGRVDDQVKIRGYRIEPGEIAAVLRDHEWVRDCAVLAVGAPPNRRLVAFYVPDGPVDDAALARHCGTLLPPYMVPTAFVALDQLPLNANGKVHRAALAALPPPGAAPREIVSPGTALERQIAEVWCTVLELDRAGVHDSFFDVGGHSIRTLSLVGALRAAKVDVTVRDVFEHRTIAELAQAIQARTVSAEEHRSSRST